MTPPRARTVVAKRGGVALAAFGLVVGTVIGVSRTTPKAPRIFGLHAVWFTGAGDRDRGEIDGFLRCLIEGTNLNRYWREEAGVRLRGSWALPPPPRQLDWHEVVGWLDGEIAAGRLPPPPPGETPMYLVFGARPQLWVGACGRNDAGQVAGREAAIAIVRLHPLCWPTGNRLRTETQIAVHEIVESADRVLGYSTCAGGGACRGRDICPDRCDTFVGLACPGAPTNTQTGCRDRRVDGWVVQKFGYAGRDPDSCDRCTPCDFTPRVCGPDEPACAALPAGGP